MLDAFRLIPALQVIFQDFVYRSSSAMQEKNPTFAQRLAYLRPRLPSVVIGAANSRI